MNARPVFLLAVRRRCRGLLVSTALTLLTSLLLVLGPAGATSASLPEPLREALARARLPADSVGVLVQAVDADRPLLELNANTPRNPASAVKLVTTWAALDMLGPTHTWRTEVYALGPVRDGVLDGDLLIKGGGDPFLVMEEMWKLTGELARTGLREIRGDLIIDDGLYAPVVGEPGDFDGRPFRLYNVQPSAALVNFNAVRFMFDPQPERGTVVVRTEPALDNLRISSHIELTSAPCRGDAPQIGMRLAGDGGPDHVVFTGQLPQTCRGYSLDRGALDARAYAFGVFRMLWKQWGGSIHGTHRQGVAPAGLEPLVVWHSPPLAEIIRPLNKWSNNVMTRLLMLAMGAQKHPPPVSRQQGAEVMLEHLAGRGLDTTGVVIDNGSGLSRQVRVPARFLVALLRKAWTEPTMPEFVASLSIAGLDGTTRRRFRNREETGHMHLKTGRLNDVAAVAGYVHAASGRIYAVAMLVNHPGAQRGSGRRLQDALLAWTFKQ